MQLLPKCVEINWFLAILKGESCTISPMSSSATLMACGCFCLSFDTASGETFTKQDMTANVVGRKVMKTQDGKLVEMGSRDQVLIVETGMNRR